MSFLEGSNFSFVGTAPVDVVEVVLGTVERLPGTHRNGKSVVLGGSILNLSSDVLARNRVGDDDVLSTVLRGFVELGVEFERETDDCRTRKKRVRREKENGKTRSKAHLCRNLRFCFRKHPSFRSFRSRRRKRCIGWHWGGGKE